MRIDWWTFALQTANLVVLIWILSRFLFRPVASIVAARREAAEKVLADAEKARMEAQQAREAAKAEASRQAAARNEALASAASQAEKEKAAILAEARADAEGIRKAARSAVSEARDRAAAAEAALASELAADIAAKVLSRLPAESRVAGFLQGLADGAAALPEETKRTLGADGPLSVVAARALSGEERETCRALLSKALGRSVEIETAVDPSLIAGLELHAPHAEVRNSFRTDLDRIATELKRHGNAEH